MTELQVGISDDRSERQRFSIGTLRLCALARFLESMAVLYPYGRILRLPLKCLLVIARRGQPIPRIARLISQRDEIRSRSLDLR